MCRGWQGQEAEWLQLSPSARRRERTRSRVRETMNPQSSNPPHPYDILFLARLCFINFPSIITNYWLWMQIRKFILDIYHKKTQKINTNFIKKRNQQQKPHYNSEVNKTCCRRIVVNTFLIYLFHLSIVF